MKKCVYSDYVHTDRLGSVVNLTDQYGRVPAQIDYDDWGKVTAYQSLNISGGYRTVLPEITYAGHQYDDVLGMYYAKARMYDAENRRFASVDPVKGRITEPMTMVQYLYVVDNPLRWVDPLGLRVTAPDDLGGGFPIPQGSANINLYLDGKIQNSNYAFTYQGTTYINTPYVEDFLGKLGVTSAWSGVDKMGKYYEINSKKVYFEKVGCEEYLSLRKAAQTALATKTLSWWKERSGTLSVSINPSTQTGPVVLKREGDKVQLYVYLEFYGDGNDFYPGTKTTYIDILTQGIKEIWSGTFETRVDPTTGLIFDDFGAYPEITLSTAVYYRRTPRTEEERAASSQQYLSVFFSNNLDTTGLDLTSDEVKRANTPRTTSWWNGPRAVEEWPGYYDIYMYAHDYRNATPYSQEALAAVMSHELGHAFGLGDAYEVNGRLAAANTVEVPQKGWLKGDIMRENGPVTSNDVEMLLEAFKMNQKQYFSDPDKSSVIRLP